MTILECLRIFGPVSLSEIARRCGMPTITTKALVRRLRLNGYAERLDEMSYDITPKGRQKLGLGNKTPLIAVPSEQ